MINKLSESVTKRNGETVKFISLKITEAVSRAMNDAGFNEERLAEKITEDVISALRERAGFQPLSVEEIQDVIEKKLIAAGRAEIAKTYILYRHTRNEIREKNAFLNKIRGLVDSYIKKEDW